MIAAEVRMWGSVIGTVSVDLETNYCSFRYNDEFLSSGIQVSPIMMPLSNEIYEFRTLPLNTFFGLPGLLSDALPDRYGNAIIDAWLVANGRTLDSFTVIERLCYIGKRGMGALEFYPDKYRVQNKIEEIEVNQLIELSNKILNKREEITSKDKNDLDDIIKVGTSAGGARAKAIIAYNEKTGIIKSGQIDAGKGFSYWILKLDGVDQQEETSFTRIEYAYYLMALDAGIYMSESRLLEKDGYYHFMTKRFDRVIDAKGKMEKLHMQTLGSLTHVDYNDPGLVSYESVTQVMYQLGMNISDNEQFFRRMVFNVITRNQDDHVKNISFLMNKKGVWSLSPAYDITYSYNPLGRWTSTHQMLVNGKRSDFTHHDLVQSGKAMKLKEKRINEIINEVKKVVGNWSFYALKAKLSQDTIDTIKNTFLTL